MGHGLLTDEIVLRSVPFTDIMDFTPLIDRLANKKIVMLGESTHGTKEFYEWRSLISSELIQKHGFNFIAVEGDWPPCQEINRFIHRKTTLNTFEALGKFNRWPTWMWGNDEMVSLIDWLREWNDVTPNEVGFHGLDVYSLFDSMDEVVLRLQEIDPQLAQSARDYYSCFGPWRGNEIGYARSLFKLSEGCQKEVNKVLQDILMRWQSKDEGLFDAAQNARIIKNAENYYRSTVLGGEDSWNIRDKHMMETLDNLLDFYGADSKAIVWEHNTHIGDYRATDMLANGHVNIGGLARQKYGDDQVGLVGFTTYTGTVIASHAWDGPIEVMEVPPAKKGSLEAVLHDSIPMVGHENYYVMFDSVKRFSRLFDYSGHRAIGVVYDPTSEHRGDYVPTSVAKRYDALVFMDETSALSPLGLRFDSKKFPETYPFGARI